MEKNTDSLTDILINTSPDNVESYLESNSGELLQADRPFAAYMRSCIKAKGLLQQEVFSNADISEGYGYKILSEEKHTRQRDTIIRLCLGAHFTLEEAQRALKIYGMSPLYPRLSRDAVLIVAFNSKTYNIASVNGLLEQNGESPFQFSSL